MERARRMPEQLSFEGPDWPLYPTDGVFFAVFPEGKAAKHSALFGRSLCSEIGLRGRPLARERLHVSLQPIGSYAGLPRSIVAAAREAASAVAMPPFDVAFDRAMSFNGRPNNQPLVLGGGDGLVGLVSLHQRLGAALREVGLRRRVKLHYTPHMTLAYGDRRITDRPIDAVGWTVQEFVLVHSLRGRTQYVPLGRWPLLG